MPSQPFSVFLPVYNEEQILAANTERLLAFLDSFGVAYDVVIGSNGSTDRTVQLGETLQQHHSNVRFFHLPASGPGAALRQALDLMRHELVVCLDMDLSSDLGFIAAALRLLKDHDIVLGSKKMGVESRSLIRRLGSDLFIFCSQRLLGLPFDDYSIGAKAYRKTVLQRYRRAIDRGTAYVQKIVYLASRDGLKVTETPLRCEDFRPSRFNLIHEASYRFAHLFRLWVFAWHYRPINQ